MFFIAYTFKGQVHVFAGRVKNVSRLSCRTSAIMKYFCPPIVLEFILHENLMESHQHHNSWHIQSMEVNKYQGSLIKY